MDSIRPIFVFSTVLLVPILYYVASIPDACARPGSPGYYSSQNCSGSLLSKEGRTCCWREPIPGSILGEKVCQTCKEEAKPGGVISETCGPQTKQSAARQPSETLPDLNQDLTTDRLPGGGIFKVPDSNVTLSQTDNSSNNTLAELQAEVENDTAQESTGENDAEEEQDGNEVNGNSNEQDE
ncbi:MAG: hypothetical protein M3P28_00110 [Thermoproteota archaeon]|nr:hypothetical protein [Thermoproteota archaeon]